MIMFYYIIIYLYLFLFDIFDDINFKKLLIFNLLIIGGCFKGVVFKMFL